MTFSDLYYPEPSLFLPHDIVLTWYVLWAFVFTSICTSIISRSFIKMAKVIITQPVSHGGLGV